MGCSLHITLPPSPPAEQSPLGGTTPPTTAPAAGPEQQGKERKASGSPRWLSSLSARLGGHRTATSNDRTAAPTRAAMAVAGDGPAEVGAASALAMVAKVRMPPSWPSIHRSEPVSGVLQAYPPLAQPGTRSPRNSTTFGGVSAYSSDSLVLYQPPTRAQLKPLSPDTAQVAELVAAALAALEDPAPEDPISLLETLRSGAAHHPQLLLGLPPGRKRETVFAPPVPMLASTIRTAQRHLRSPRLGVARTAVQLIIDIAALYGDQIWPFAGGWVEGRTDNEFEFRRPSVPG